MIGDERGERKGSEKAIIQRGRCLQNHWPTIAFLTDLSFYLSLQRHA